MMLINIENDDIPMCCISCTALNNFAECDNLFILYHWDLKQILCI